MGTTVDETISTPAGNVDVKFDSATDVTQIRSTLNLQFQNYVYASGDFLVEKTTVGDLTTFKLAASDLDAFLGVNYNAAGEFGAKVTDAGVAMLIEKQGTNAAKYAISTTGGTVGLVGLPGVDLSGPLALNINKLGRTIDVDIPSPTGVNIPLEFTSPDLTQRFGGDLNLSIGGFTTLSGTYAFEIDTATAGRTKVFVAGTNINALLGSDHDGVIGTADDAGARITDGRIGAVFYKTTAGTSYALDAAGTASLVGVTGFTLSGSLAARVNTTGGEVNESIAMPTGAPVSVVFSADDTAPVFKGSVTADASGFASLSGSFAISKASERLKVAVAGATAFVGADDVGLKLTGGNLGMVINTTARKYAIVAGGSISLEGISGFSVGGSASVRINTLGEPVSQTISTPAGDVTLDFPTSAEVLQVSGSVNLTVSDYVDATATITVEKESVGDLTHLTVSASNANALLGVGASTVSTFDDMGPRSALDQRQSRRYLVLRFRSTRNSLAGWYQRPDTRRQSAG
jgi:hypothetical protein